MTQYLKIQHLPTIAGRTFVAGDIHGSYSCVQRFLNEIQFDEQKDRLICAGDLIDRGPQNELCLELLWKPWFFMVRGNHEQLMEAYFNRGYYGQFWAKNGGGWGLLYDQQHTDAADRVRAALKIISELPYLLTVNLEKSKFHVLHAELPKVTVPITDDMLADPDTFTRLATTQTNEGDIIIWGRYIFSSLYREDLSQRTIDKFKRRADIEKLGMFFNENLSHIYSGHTIVHRPVTFRGQTNLDTCAYGSYSVRTRYDLYDPPTWCGLTITEPETGKFWLVNDREFKEVQPIVIE